jgi:hypothetical protein
MNNSGYFAFSLRDFSQFYPHDNDRLSMAFNPSTFLVGTIWAHFFQSTGGYLRDLFRQYSVSNSSFGREVQQKREGPAVIAGPSQSTGKFGVAFRLFGT